MLKEFDVAVIGGGPAGYVAAIKAAMLGGKVVLFEKSVVGGTCLNRGCIPTKSYIKTAEVMHEIIHAHKRGIVNDAKCGVDMGKVVAYKNDVVKKLTGGVAGLLKSHGVSVVYGEAAMETEKTIVCGGETYGAKSVLLCGGSVVGMVPIKGIETEGVLTSDSILDLTVLPKRLLVIGGGVIGCEIATAFGAFGSKVTIVEAMPGILPMLDAELSAQTQKIMKGNGIDVITGKGVEEISKTSGGLAVKVDGKIIECDNVLLSVGRKPDLTCLGKLKDKVTTERGYVVVDDKMRTNIANIYAPGDINGRSMLAHSAFKMGEVAAANALGHNETCDLSLVPSCVYTIPEVASVGMDEKTAMEKLGKDAIGIGRFPFAANGRALASGTTDGFIKVIIDKKYGEVLGVHMMGACVTEMIAEPASLMAMEVTAYEIKDIIHAHPTMSEAFMEACADALGECIHLPKR